MPRLDVLAYRFPNESASLAGYQAVMQKIEGGSAYRLHTPTGELPPTLVVFAFSNYAELHAACREAGGAVTVVAPEMLRELAARSMHAAEHNIVGRRHHDPGTPPGESLPDRQGDYRPRGE